MAHIESRWERKQSGKKRMEKLAKESQFVYYDEESGHYKKDSFSKNTKRVKQLKRQYNKKVRQMEDIDDYGGYHKLGYENDLW